MYRFSGFLIGAIKPFSDAIGIAVFAPFAPRIEQDKYDRAIGNLGPHHQTMSGFSDITRFTESDIPPLISDEAVGVHEPDFPPRPKIRHKIHPNSRQLTDQRI